MYGKNSVRVMADYGGTEPIQITQGVRQGEPMSPPLLNLFINPIIETMHKSKIGYQLENGGKVGIGPKVFADNTALVNSTSEGLENSWNMLAQFCADKGLRIKASKSAYTTNGRNRTFTSTTKKGDQVVRLRPDEVYRYLGVLSNGWFVVCLSLQILREPCFFPCSSLGPISCGLISLFRETELELEPVARDVLEDPRPKDIWGRISPSLPLG